jgi:hypothetical protein
MLIFAERQMSPEHGTLPCEGAIEAPGVFSCGAGQTKLADLKRNHRERAQSSTGNGKGGQVHNDEVVAEMFIPSDPLVVVEKVATAVKYQLLSIEFDAFSVT